jgi:hypothetical protein
MTFGDVRLLAANSPEITLFGQPNTELVEITSSLA